MFLVNSRQGRFPAASFRYSPARGFHVQEAPLLPKLRGQLAEFLSEGSPARLSTFMPAHLCRFAVRSPWLQRPRGYFLAVWEDPVPGGYPPVPIAPQAPDRDFPRSFIALQA